VRLVADGRDAPGLAAAARAGGMTTLWESGAAAVRSGVTSVEELLRVLDPPSPARPEPAPPPRARVAEERPARRGAERPRALLDLDATFELLPPVARCLPRGSAPPAP
jgi:hypothetical protein